MLDKWFSEDIKKGLNTANRFVIIDPQKSCGKLMEVLQKENIADVFDAHSEIEELKVKYDIEKNYVDKKVIIYSTISLNKLTWVREYCETGGRLEINYLHRYITDKVTEKLHKEMKQPEPFKIKSIGILSIGNDENYWKKIIETDEIFSTEEILKFLSKPMNKYNSFDKSTQKLFVEYLSQHTEHSLLNKPPKTIAEELAKALFTYLHSDGENSFYDDLYKKWINSKRDEKTLKRYLKQFKIPPTVHIWDLSSNHPFKDVDMKCLKELSENIHNQQWLRTHLPIIHKRSKEEILSVLNTNWWQDIYALFEFDISGVASIQSIDDGIDYFKTEFYKVDMAVRHLYTIFLSDKERLKPIQEYYESLTMQFLDKWFTYFANEYKENQTGYLKTVITENNSPIAIIVGDAISFEVSQEITNRLDSSFEVKSDVIKASFPSETENCMSRLFSESGKIFSDRKKRHQALQDETGKEIEFMELDDVSPAHTTNDYTIFYSADVDELSEKQNQSALKYYGEFISGVGEKIETLFGCGYQKVFLVSDHGFVLTGILEESDKIEINGKGGKKSERYYLSTDKAKDTSKSILEIKEPHKDAKYQYYSKSMNPFKTRGAYGFSHGGITPQELLIPNVMINKSGDDFNKLKVEIGNKTELRNVVGDIYQVKIVSGDATGDIFSIERKVILVFAKDKIEFNRSSIITIKAGEVEVKEFEFEDEDDFDILLIDAKTKSTLDSCKINKQIARDLGGLGEN